MTNTTLKHKLPCGTIATYQGPGRPTHIVIARADAEALLSARSELDPLDRIFYEAHSRIVAAGPGRRLKGQDWRISEQVYENALSGLRGAKTVTEFQELKRDERVANHHHLYKGEKIGPWYVVEWVRSLEYAKQVRTWEVTGWKVHEALIQEVNHGK